MNFIIAAVSVLSVVGCIVFFVLCLFSLGENGCLLHCGFELYNPNVVALCNDIIANPGRYVVDEFRLESDLVSIWVGNGWMAYKDYSSSFRSRPHKVGSFSIPDRFLFRRALKALASTPNSEFLEALSKRNKS